MSEPWSSLAGQILPWASLALAAIPALMVLRNVSLYRPPAEWWDEPEPVSVLIPARDEEASIEAAVRSALASRGVELEVVVLDDGSTDRTARIVADLAAEDPRVRLEAAPPLPAGWVGKQHACWQLSRLARHPVLLFVDADVRLAPEAVARATGFLRRSGAGMVSGVPRQETGTWLEKLLIPLIHFVLLGFLPIARMRASTAPAYGAACGQLVVCDRRAYEQSGGHRAIAGSLHDGVSLPRSFRGAGFATDLVDVTDLAVCRMYRSAGEVWRGLAKNATEGMATPAGIVPWTLMLGVGQVLPPLLFAVGIAGLARWLPVEPPPLSWQMVALAATVLVYLPRLQMMPLYRQTLLGVLAHPLAVALLLLIQWQALLGRLLGRSPSWKGREYAATDRSPDPTSG